LKNFFNNEKGTYEFTILTSADSAKPLRAIKVAFDFDPKADELTFNTVDAARFPRWYYPSPHTFSPRVADEVLTRRGHRTFTREID
jgi:hypothetical protein